MNHSLWSFWLGYMYVFFEVMPSSGTILNWYLLFVSGTSTPGRCICWWLLWYEDIEAMAVPATGLPLSLNCVLIFGGRDLRDAGKKADSGLFSWDWENLCSDLGDCSRLRLLPKMVPGTVISFDRLICKASGEGRDERKVDSLSVDIQVIARLKKRVTYTGWSATGKVDSSSVDIQVIARLKKRVTYTGWSATDMDSCCRP